MAWLRTVFALPLGALVALIAIYRFNRAWMEKRMAGKSAADSFKGLILVTILVWFAIWLFAADEHRGRLSQAVETFWSEVGK